MTEVHEVPEVLEEAATEVRAVRRADIIADIIEVHKDRDKAEDLQEKEALTNVNTKKSQASQGAKRKNAGQSHPGKHDNLWAVRYASC